MLNFTIEDFPKMLHDRLRVLAEWNGRSMEAEAIACLERELMANTWLEDDFLEMMRMHRDVLPSPD